MRSTERVRDAGPDDIETVVGFAAQVSAGSTAAADPLARLADGVIGHSMRDRYARLLADPEHRVVLAEREDGVTVGVAVFSVDTISALLAVPVVSVSHVIIPDLDRQRSVGRALVAAAAEFADDIGADHVMVGLTATGRESNRFFARLGFAPLLVRRIASVATLRRALGDATEPATRPVYVPGRRRLAAPLLRARARHSEA